MSENTSKNTLENKKTGAKMALSATMWTFSVLYSSLLAVGLFLGYLGSKIYYKKFVETGKVNKVYVDFGKWKFHFHHWIMGAIVLVLVWVIDWFYLPRFFVGVVGGIIAHDIYDFNDWYKILLRNNKDDKK